MEVNHQIPGQHVYEGMVMASCFKASTIDRMKNVNFDGSVSIVTYPKTGTTWAQELTWLVKHKGDFDGAKQTPLHERVMYCECDDVDGTTYLDIIEKLEAPLLWKSHLPAGIFTKHLDGGKVKFIVVIRNPKDTLVSYYHFYRSNVVFGHFAGTWDDFFKLYETKHLSYGDFFDWYLSWWQHKDNPNVLFVKYEDMKKDLPAEVRKIAEFLDQQLSDDLIEEIAKHGQFDAMKKNKMTNYTDIPSEYVDQKISPFMRKGLVGDWKNYFSVEQSKKVDEKYETEFKSNGLELDFE